MDNRNAYDLSSISEDTDMSLSFPITSTENSKINFAYGDLRPVQQDQNETNLISELPWTIILEVLNLSFQDLFYCKDEISRNETAVESIPRVSSDDRKNNKFIVEKKTSDNDVTYSKFKYQSDLNSHTSSHTGEKHFKCEMCGKKFLYRSKFNRHNRIHTGEKPFDCTTCGKKFTTRGNLKQHNLIHTGEKPFDCTTCGKKFNNRDNLKQHNRIHTGEKPFVCTTCKKEFRHSNSFKSHTRAHTGVSPYVCETCGKKFAVNASLQKHIKTHNDLKP